MARTSVIPRRTTADLARSSDGGRCTARRTMASCVNVSSSPTETGRTHGICARAGFTCGRRARGGRSDRRSLSPVPPVDSIWSSTCGTSLPAAPHCAGAGRDFAGMTGRCPRRGGAEALPAELSRASWCAGEGGNSGGRPGRGGRTRGRGFSVRAVRAAGRVFAVVRCRPLPVILRKPGRHTNLFRLWDVEADRGSEAGERQAQGDSVREVSAGAK